MASRTIILFLFSIFFQKTSVAQLDSVFWHQNFEKKIDSVITHAIQQQAFPGCVIYASKSGEPFFFKSYGYHTYDSLQATLREDIFDLASITKVMASTLAIMKLYDEGKIDLDAELRDYVDGLGWRKIRKATIRECLSHQAGLKSWIKYYEEIQKRDGAFRRKTISSIQSEDYPFPISGDMFLHKDFYKKIKKMIRKTEVDPSREYLYSGLFFYLVPEIVKNVTGVEFSDYLKLNFYAPLGATTVGFNPKFEFPLESIVPTEIDTFFRKELIHGDVHDEGAILMEGISGNAGLFGNARDVAKVWHMLMNDGKMDSISYLSPQTIDLFTAAHYANQGNRRGLGFDKPLLEYDSIMSSVARSATYESYGHTGFTGTLVWSDPKEELLFIFLSNRVYPTRDNRAIYKLNVRPTIHELLYEGKDALEKLRIFVTLLNLGCWF